MIENNIQFISTIPGVIGQEDIHPYPASKAIPNWWKEAPYDSGGEESRYHPESMFVRRCPAFPDLFSSGFIVPMWADTTLYYNKKTDEYRWRCGAKESPFKINFFNNRSFIDYGKYYLNGIKATAMFHFISPWTIIAPEGCSMFQFPIFFNETENYGVMPGTFDADITMQSKIEVGYFTDDKEIFIKRGTPLVQYIPYKKIDASLVVREFNNEDVKRSDKFHIRAQSTFKNWYGQNRRRPSHG